MDESTLFTMHQKARREGLALAYGRPVVLATAARARDPRRLLAESAEREALIRLILEGYKVEPTYAHDARYDLLCDGVLRVEVKASRWTPTTGGRGRYSCLYHNKADVLCWLCSDVGRWFIIPCQVLDGRRNLAIWSFDPTTYRGQWAPYLGAWSTIGDLVTLARARGQSWTHQARLI